MVFFLGNFRSLVGQPGSAAHHGAGWSAPSPAAASLASQAQWRASRVRLPPYQFRTKGRGVNSQLRYHEKMIGWRAAVFLEPHEDGHKTQLIHCAHRGTTGHHILVSAKNHDVSGIMPSCGLSRSSFTLVTNSLFLVQLLHERNEALPSYLPASSRTCQVGQLLLHAITAKGWHSPTGSRMLVVGHGLSGHTAYSTAPAPPGAKVSERAIR